MSNLKQFPRKGDRIMRLPEVKSRTGLSRSTIYERIADGQFPRQKRLGPQSVGWLESEIDGFLAALPEAG